MSIKRFFKRLVDSEVCGEEMIATQVKCYGILAAENPKYEPHDILMWLWKARTGNIRKLQIDDAIQAKVTTATSMFACLPYPDNARALALWFIAQERPDIIQEYPKFSAEYLRLLAPINQAIEDETFLDMYRRSNPIMASRAFSP